MERQEFISILKFAVERASRDLYEQFDFILDEEGDYILVPEETSKKREEEFYKMIEELE